VAARGSERLSRILLIDDTPEVAELLTFALRDLGHEVFAHGYTDAVNELIDEHHPHGLILDCSAYDMSEGLFDIVRQHPQHIHLPIVIITDTPELADPSLEARKAEKVLLIPKPFTASQVARALADLLK
jgi:CheY-like chemotaxis protein